MSGSTEKSMVDISMITEEQKEEIRDLQVALMTDVVAVGMTAAGTDPMRTLPSPGASTSLSVGPMMIALAMVATTGARAEGKAPRKEMFLSACEDAFDSAQRMISENSEQWACAVEEFRAHWHGETPEGVEDEAEEE